MAKPAYPKEVLSQPHWVESITTGDILKCCSTTLLGHLLVGDKNQCIDSSLGDGMEFIRREALPLERMANLSCSLLGTYFKLAFFHFLPDNEGKKTWKAGTLIAEELLAENNYNHYPTITVVGWHLRNLEHYPIPYPRIFSKAKDYAAFQTAAVAVADLRKCEIVQKEWHELAKNVKNEEQKIADFSGEVRCNHAPTMLNYWHFTIDLYPADDNDSPLKNTSKGWREKMGIYLQDYLCNSYILLTKEEQIPQIADKNIWVKEN